MRWSFRPGGRRGESRRGLPPSPTLVSAVGRGEESAGAGKERERGRGVVGANVDSNPSGGEPSTGRFISTRPPPPLLAREHPPPPRQSLHRLTFSPSSARGIKFGREAVSNILCSDSPTSPPLFRPLSRIPSLPPLPSPLFRSDPERSAARFLLPLLKGREFWKEIV